MIAALVAIGKVAFWPPENLLAWWSPVSLGMAVSSGLIVGVGQSSLFPWICRLPGIAGVSPDISGNWRATLQSNWPKIASMANLHPGNGAEVTADIKVVARLLTVTIKFISDDKYSKSKSVSVSVKRDDNSGDIRIYYTYENTTETPHDSDSSHHFGSAYVDIEDSGPQMSLEGSYWTNRNWNAGLNTAGTIVWTRVKPVQ